MKNLKNAVCYKTKEPVYYNKGTKWEKKCDTFLAYYIYKSDIDAQKEVDEINTKKPEKLFNGELADCENRFYFINKQEEMY